MNKKQRKEINKALLSLPVCYLSRFFSPSIWTTTPVELPLSPFSGCSSRLVTTSTINSIILMTHRQESLYRNSVDQNSLSHKVLFILFIFISKIQQICSDIGFISSSQIDRIMSHFSEIISSRYAVSNHCSDRARSRLKWIDCKKEGHAAIKQRYIR